MRPILISAVLLVLASTAQAGDEPVQTIPPFPRSCSSTPYGETCLHVFGGMNTRIPLPGSGQGCKGKKVQIYQLSTRLRAPVGKPITLDGSNCATAIFPLPDVKAITGFRVAYLDRADPVPGEATLLMAYPTDLWAPLKEWSLVNHLIVSDLESKLIPLLERQHINYSPVMLGESKNVKQVCIWIPRQDDAAEEPPFNCSPLLVLHEKTESFPLIHVSSDAEQLRTDVYMPLLDALSAHPLVQKTFVDLIQSQL